MTVSLDELFRSRGELLVRDGKLPFLLEGSNNFWYIHSGMVEIFTVKLVRGEPVGGRSHFLTRRPGQCMFGIDIEESFGSGFLAVGSPDTCLYRIGLSELKNLANQEEYIHALSDLLDEWISELSWNLTKNRLPHPKANVNISEGDEVSLRNGQRIRSNKGVLWLETGKSEMLFVDDEDILFDNTLIFFPFTTDTWLRANQKSEIAAKGSRTSSVLCRPDIWDCLKNFHTKVCRSKFSFRQQENRTQKEWKREKEDYSKRSKKLALLDIASVLDERIALTIPTEKKGNQSAVFLACKLVAEYAGISIKEPSDSDNEKKQTVLDQLYEIAKKSKFRIRSVLLKGKWYKKDQGPMLATLADNNQPVALLPSGTNNYECINPASCERKKLNHQFISSLGYKAFSFYRCFPDGILSLYALLKFGAMGLKADLQMLLVAGGLIGALGALTPYFTGQIFDTVIPQANFNLLCQFSIALVVTAFASGAFEVCRGIAVLRIQGKMDYSLQAALWDRLLNLPSSFFRKYSAGDLADRVNGIAKIRDLLSGTSVSAILGGMSSVFYVALMFKYSFGLALTGLLLTFFLVGFTFAVNLMRLKYQRQQVEMNGNITGLTLQLVSGVSKLRVTGSENFAFRRWAKDFAAHRRVSIAVGKIQNLMTMIMSGFPVIASMIIFWALVWLQSRSEQGGIPLSTGEFIGFNSAYGMFQSAMLAIGESSMDFFRVIPIYERLKPIITTPPEVDEVKSHPGELTGEIEVSHLRFRYTSDGPWVTKNVSFKIRPGEFVAFVGGSGSGKSTIMRLLLGFEIPESGTVYYDGQDLGALDLREVRQQIGVVLQSSQLLPSTIFENIVGTSSLTVDDAWEAARMSGLADDIKQMPMGMHTVVSEGGGTFSGGQRQRLMIARAIVNRPRIMFLDEATSALDNRTQAQVTESLDRLQATRIVIAHRLSTVINADRIYVLDHGEIKESGSYRELMEKNGIFADLAKRQIV